MPTIVRVLQQGRPPEDVVWDGERWRARGFLLGMLCNMSKNGNGKRFNWDLNWDQVVAQNLVDGLEMTGIKATIVSVEPLTGEQNYGPEDDL